MTWGVLAQAVSSAQPAPDPVPLLHTRDLAQVMDTHIAWQTTGTGSASRALRLPAMFAAVRLLAATVDQLPLTVDGGPTPRWLREPRYAGAHLDQGDLIQHLVTSMLLAGAGYAVCEMTDKGWRVDALRGDAVGALPAADGTLRVDFTINGRPVQRLPYGGGGPGPYLLHVPYLVVGHRPQGTSPAVELAEAIDGYLDAERQAANLLDSGTWSGGILSTDQDISADAAARWQQAWVDARKLGKIPVLGAGLSYTNEAIDPVKAQYLESRTFAASQIAQAFGIPPDILGMALMGSGSSLSYNNAADNLRRLKLSAVAQITTQLSDALSPLLRAPDGGQRVVFDYDEWERGGDIADTAAAGPEDA